MKLTAILTIVVCLHAGAKGFTQITLSETNKPLQKVFRQIQKQSGYEFFYAYSLVQRAGNVTVRLNNVPLHQAVEEVLKGKNLSYEIVGNTVVIRKGETAPAETAGPAASSPPITGRILNESGLPLEGASVKVKGTSIGTTTDAEGRYTINANSGQILVISYIGYDDREITVGAEPPPPVQLELSVASLSEVVVGYGTRKRESVTGAVSAVTSEVIRSRPITNTLTALQGTLPGVTIQRGSGKPGSENFNLNVRGNSTVDRNRDGTDAGNTPLVLIDGLAANLELLNPDDIESVTVLKDAAASIYGARAANGVMLVTTKKGRRGPPRITLSSNFAMSKVAGMMKSPTNYEFAIMDNEANRHAGATPMYTEDLLERIRNNDPNPIPHPLYGGWNLFFTNTDWQRELYDPGFQHKHYLNVSGGGDNSRYYLSGSFADQQGVIRFADDNNKRYNLRMNYDYDFSKRIRLETKVAFESQRRTDVGGNGEWSGTIIEGVFGMPNHPVYSSDGKFFAQGGWGNALAQARDGATATYLSRNINTNFKLISNITDNFRVNVQGGVNFRTDNDEDIAKPVPLYNWEGDLTYYDIASPGLGSLTLRNTENTYRNVTAYAEYNKQFGDHSLNIMAGASHEENDMKWFSARRDNFISEELWSINLGGTNNMTNDGGGNHWAISSLFSRIAYSFNNEYLLEANLRYDGSSRFASGSRWGFFPGISAAWRLTERDFIRNSSVFDDLKLRLSYGQTGNQEGIGLYDHLQLITTTRRANPYPFGPGSQTRSASLVGMAATMRTWETLINQNAGIDASLLRSRLNVTFDYFIKTNRNLLIPVTYPSLLGVTPPYSNSGELRTKGFELTVGWKDKVGKLDYSARVLVSDAQNKLTNYGGADTYVTGMNWIREGYPLDSYFAYQFDGIIRDQRELDEYRQLQGVPGDIGIGDAKFRDINGDGIISPYSNVPGEDGDVINVGTIIPRYTIGLNLTARYGQFDVVVFVQGVARRTLFREGEYSIPWTDWWRQPPQFYYGKTWNEDRPDAEYPRLSHGNIRWWNYQPSTLQKINAAYARLKNLQVGYTFPKRVTDRVAITSARVYFSGQDMFEIHGVKGGWDPESSTTGFNYPFQRMYSFGFDITF